MFQILHALSWLSFRKSMISSSVQTFSLAKMAGEAQNLLAKTEFLLACG